MSRVAVDRAIAKELSMLRQLVPDPYGDDYKVYRDELYALNASTTDPDKLVRPALEVRDRYVTTVTLLGRTLMGRKPLRTAVQLTLGKPLDAFTLSKLEELRRVS